MTDSVLLYKGKFFKLPVLNPCDSTMKKTKNILTVYFHNDFDGIVSALLATEYLSMVKGYKNFDYKVVSYDLKPKWPSLKLKHPNAIVDFLFHSQADYWWDHHQTTFLNNYLYEYYEKNKKKKHFHWNLKYPSCAKLIYIKDVKSLLNNVHYEELVHWSDVIDSANYESPEQAIECKEPALQINLSMLMNKSPQYLYYLLNLFKKRPLSEVAKDLNIQEKFKLIYKKQKKGIDLFCRQAKTIDNICIFQTSQNIILNRYTPFYCFSNAWYSITTLQRNDMVYLSAMKNPWKSLGKNKKLVHLGELFRHFGGGGHRTIGTVIFKDKKGTKAKKINEEILGSLLSNSTGLQSKDSKRSYCAK